MNDGGSAFPLSREWDDVHCQWMITAEGGMTLRQYYAGQVIQGALAASEAEWTPTGLAQWAVNVADALIAELARDEEET